MEVPLAASAGLVSVCMSLCVWETVAFGIMMDGSTFWASNSKSPFIITIIKFGGGINDGIIAIFG